MEAYNLVSLAGIAMLMLVAWLFSRNRGNVNFRVVLWGSAIQLTLALFIFVVPAGSRLFAGINDLVVRVLECASEGSYFLFGRLALPPGAERDGQSSLGFILAFQALPTIIFFSALMSLLYWIGIMQRVIRGFAWLFARLMRVSGAESLCASSNIFVGIESAFTVRPYIERMTCSELCTVLTAGMATIASNVLALYVFILQGQFPMIAGHLVSASLLSAPAALVMAKLVYPEDEKPETLGVAAKGAYTREDSPIHAIINGANAGVKLIVGIAALLLAFLGLVALFNLPLQAAGDFVAGQTGRAVNFRLEAILGVLAYPFTLLMGVPIADAREIARLIGERVVVTEVKAYQDLAVLLQNGALVHPRSAVIATYGLCGFTHIPSLAIFMGGIAALVPSRAKDLGRIGPRALLAATLACMMTAAVAGTCYNERSILLDMRKDAAGPRRPLSIPEDGVNQTGRIPAGSVEPPAGTTVSGGAFTDELQDLLTVNARIVAHLDSSRPLNPLDGVDGRMLEQRCDGLLERAPVPGE